MIKQVFYATVTEDCELKFINPFAVKNHLLPLRGQTVEVTAVKRRKRRSNEQNAYYHGVVLKLIADHCGYRGSDDLEGLHESLKQKFLPKSGLLQIPKSTTALTTVEFEEYLEDIRRWAANELCIYIPVPNEAQY